MIELIMGSQGVAHIAESCAAYTTGVSRRKEERQPGQAPSAEPQAATPTDSGKEKEETTPQQMEAGSIGTDNTITQRDQSTHKRGIQ